MASQSQGIQQLLQAEKRAAEKVSEARKREFRGGVARGRESEEGGQAAGGAGGRGPAAAGRGSDDRRRWGFRCSPSEAREGLQVDGTCTGESRSGVETVLGVRSSWGLGGGKMCQTNGTLSFPSHLLLWAAPSQ